MKNMTKLILSAMFVLFAGGALIDNPTYAAETFTQSGPSGGLRGNSYSDNLTGGLKIKEVRVSSGRFIDSIQVIYTDKLNKTVTGKKHGGPGGNLSVLKLADDEYITTIGGKFGWYIDSLFIRTSKDQVKKWGGLGGDVDYYYSTPPGTSIHGFFGRAGKYIDSLGVIMKTVH